MMQPYWLPTASENNKIMIMDIVHQSKNCIFDPAIGNLKGNLGRLYGYARI